jgi:hypothetical protein
MQPAKSIGWGPGALRAVGLLVIGAALLVVVPNLLVTKLTGLSRDARVAVAVAWFAVTLVASTWVLRRLQARDII